MILTLLIISALFNVFFVWYIYYLLKKLLFVSDNMGEFLEILKNYSEHIETVYNMETYYGDETIQHLLEYSRDIVKEIEAYEEIYDITHVDKEEIDEEEIDKEEIDEEEAVND